MEIKFYLPKVAYVQCGFAAGMMIIQNENQEMEIFFEGYKVKKEWFITLKQIQYLYNHPKILEKVRARAKRAIIKKSYTANRHWLPKALSV